MSTTAGSRSRRAQERPGAVDRALSRLNWPVLTQLLAAGAAFALGVRIPLINGVEVGTVVAIALLPVWWPELRRYRGARTLFFLTSAALVTGALLTFLARGDRDFSRPLLQGESGQLLIVLLGIGLLLWVRSAIGVMPMALWFSVGLFLAGFLHPTDLGYPWKYDFGIPATFALLALAAWRGPRPALEVPIAVLLAGSFAVNDARSLFGLVMLAALAGVVQALVPRGGVSRRALVVPVLLLAAAALAVYRATTWALSAGLLGEAAQRRTQLQQDLSGSLLFGGRPEIGASVRLIEQQWWGYGSGTMANHGDVDLARLGMGDVWGRIPDFGYVVDYMLVYGYTMHSTAAEFWINYGLPGLALALAVVAVMAVALFGLLADHRLTVLAAFAVVNTLWNLAFSPTVDTVYQMVLTLAVVLLPVARTAAGARPEAEHPVEALPTGAVSPAAGRTRLD